MAKILIVAEKPSVAKDIAAALGVSRQGDVYENGDIVITNCIGHLVEIYVAEAEGYGAALPIIPNPFGLQAIAATADQFKRVKSQMLRGDISAVVNACDAGREGEAIFRYTYELANCKKPIERMWLQSMTAGGIKAAWDGRKEGNLYNSFWDAARSRSEADWLVGINGSRACKKPVGRVMTPTLAIVVDRFIANRDFKPRDFYEVQGTFAIAKGEFKAKWIPKNDSGKQVEDIAIAENVVAKCKGINPSSITDESKPTKSSPPFLFDLTSLQREANKKFGLSAAKTLQIAQSLYEKHKVTSYPRTDSQRLPEDYVSKCGNILQSMTAVDGYAKLAKKPLEQGWVKANKRIFDDAKISDHFAIIPTGIVPSGLDASEQKVFDLILQRFVAIFYPDAEFLSTTRSTIVANELFRASGRVLTSAGFLEVMGKQEDEEKEPSLPPLGNGETGKTVKVEILKQKTKRPALYTEATLLTAMETAGKSLDDEEYADAMKERSLGTPATRAATIEKLLKAGKNGAFMSRNGKHLVPTERGIVTIAQIRESIPSLASPVLTGEWEYRLLSMEKGGVTRTEFMRQIEAFATEIVAAMHGKASTERSRQEFVETDVECPQCKELLGFNGRVLGHDQASACKFKVWASISKREMSLDELKKLVREGSLPTMAGFVSKAGKAFSAGLKLKESDGCLEFVFTEGEKSDAPCPCCKKSLIINGKKLDCECGFSIWTSVCGVDLSKKHLDGLLKKGRTGLIEGFKNKSGKKFSASLVLDAQGSKITFDFAEANEKKAAEPKMKAGDVCPSCKKGKLSNKKSKDGRGYLGCSSYPDCKFFQWVSPQ